VVSLSQNRRILLNRDGRGSVSLAMTARSNRRGRWVLATATALVALMLAALMGGSASAGETASASKTKTVEIVSFAFKPPTLTIGKGSSVTFSNTSSVTHTATRKGDFNTGPIKPGKSATVRFARKGTFAYHCKIHPSMRGKIVVN
jgi:plastocyanin